MSVVVELFWRFLLIGTIAFGGGQAALPLVQGMTVHDTGWISNQDFSTALAFTYITPGPVLILSTFIGYRVMGVPGALAATVGVFLIPFLLSAAAAHAIRRYIQHPRLRGFGRGAGPAMVGLLGVTAILIAEEGLGASTNVPVAVLVYALIGIVAFALAVQRRLNPFFILLGGALVGAGASAVFGLG